MSVGTGAGAARDAGPAELRLLAEAAAVCGGALLAGWGLRLAVRGTGVEPPAAVLVPAWILLQVAVIAAVLRAAGASGARRRIEGLGVRPSGRELREGLVTGVVGLGVLALLEWALEAGPGVSLLPRGEGVDEATARVVELARSHPWASVAAVAVAGAVEEVVFRGWGVLLVRRARPSLAVPALVASSLLFGAAHTLVPPGFFLYFALVGLVYGGAALASDSVVPGVLLHGGTNAAVAAAVAFGGAGPAV